MTMLITVSIVLTVVIVYQGVIIYLTMHQHRKHIEHLHTEWHSERKQLMDRIHANSFNEYKGAEIKMEKAKKDEPHQPKVELL